MQCVYFFQPNPKTVLMCYPRASRLEECKRCISDDAAWQIIKVTDKYDDASGVTLYDVIRP